MKKRCVMKTAAFVLAMVLAVAIGAAQAGEVKLQGKIINDGKGIMATEPSFPPKRSTAPLAIWSARRWN